MFVPAMLKAVLETAADLVEKLAPSERGPLGPLVVTTLRELATASYDGDRIKLLATLRALRDDGVKVIDEAELDQQVADAIARRQS